MPTRINSYLRTQFANAIPKYSLQLRIYTGTQPASADTEPTGTLLATITNIYLTQTSSGATLSGGPYSATAVAAGIAGWARLTDGYINIDGAVGTSGQQFNLSDINIVNGDTVTLNGMNIQIPTEGS